MLSSEHEYLKGLLTDYFSLLSQERDTNKKLEGNICQLENDIKFVCSLVNNSVVESERLQKCNKFLNGRLYNFNVELEPPRVDPTDDEFSQFC